MIFAKFSGGGFSDSASSLGDREILSVPPFDGRFWGKGNSSYLWPPIAEPSPCMGSLMGLITRNSMVDECMIAKRESQKERTHEPRKTFNTPGTSGRK